MRLLTAVDIVLLNGHKRKRKSCYVWNLDTICDSENIEPIYIGLSIRR